VSGPGLLCLAGALGAHGAAAQGAAVAYGMSFSFLEVDLSRVSSCSTVSRGATIRNAVFITRYDQPAIRTQVQQALAAMRHSGFQSLRLVVYFGPDAKSRDWFDLHDGTRAGALVKQYADDVKAAGFTELFLAFAIQGTASPACRVQQWSDCFDSHSTALASQFITTLRAALGPTEPLPMRYDLALEMCSPADLQQPLRSNLLGYAKAVIAAYGKRFPGDATTVSCSLARFPGGRRSIDAAYAAAGLNPAFYDVHFYNRPDQDESVQLRALGLDLKDSQLPIVIGETSFGDRANLQSLMRDLVVPTGRVPAIYFWPLKDQPSGCHVDVAPPYGLDRAKG
jgi:hypothetical protein